LHENTIAIFSVKTIGASEPQPKCLTEGHEGAQYGKMMEGKMIGI